MENVKEKLELLSFGKYNKNVENLNVNELYDVVSTCVISAVSSSWQKSYEKHLKSRRACYFSAEYLVGQPLYKNLMCLDLLRPFEDALSSFNRSLNEFETVPDELLGNGGLGRLAACFLDSGANLSLPLDGYGIKYKFGLFKQKIENGFQIEDIEDVDYNDPWCVPCFDDRAVVHFKEYDVYATPYDMPIVAYGSEHFSTLRLWQCEPIKEFDFKLFNEQKYDLALKQKNDAENISRLLYPNDSTPDGKKLRFKQQYFFTCASLQDIIKKYKKYHCDDYCHFAEYITIQLNDTHPVVAIPELIRLLTLDGCTFDYAFDICCRVFNFTNHTIMAEALEKWDLNLIDDLCPEIARIIINIDKKQAKELSSENSDIQIIQNGMVHMANLACFVCKFINGVANLHTEILKSDTLNSWYKLSPNKFQNKTNGITQRRFLRLCNPKLSELVTDLLGSEEWITDLSKLKELEKFADNKDVLERFMDIKKENKQTLSNYILKLDNDSFSPDFIVDSQIKRLHEYKRQFLNILVILELYFELEEKSLTDFTPTVFIFGAKSAPGYERAKGIIKLINEVKRLVEANEYVSRFIKIVFVSDYSVSYAEKIIPATDISKQISTAGTEASGTGNMKFMLNGAVTLGTFDGANIEIVQNAGKENNYIFGARVEDIEKIKSTYDPKKIYNSDQKIKRCLDALVNGTLSDNNTGIFKELYTSILDGASWHKADNYYLLLDFEPMLQTELKANNDYKDKYAFARKCFLNMCNAGFFSSDRTILDYAENIWDITKTDEI